MIRLIRFEGCWTEDGKRRVRSATQDAEPTGPEPRLFLVEALWVATCHRESEWAVFGAPATGTWGGLSAESAAGLAEQIRKDGSRPASASGPG